MTLPGLGDMLRSGVALLARHWRWVLLLAVLVLAYLAWCRWGQVATPPTGRPIAAPMAAVVANMPTKSVTIPLRVIADKPAAARRLKLGALGPAQHEEIQTAADSRVSLSTTVSTSYDTRTTLATAITSLADTLADISSLAGYSVRHDTRLAISSARTWAADTRAGVSTSVSAVHDARLAVSRVIGVLADTMADISSAVGYQISHDTRLTVRTQFSHAADSLAAISRQIAVAQDTRVIVGLIQQAIGDIVALARERRIITLSPEQRIYRLPRGHA